MIRGKDALEEVCALLGSLKDNDWRIRIGTVGKLLAYQEEDKEVDAEVALDTA